MSRTQGIGRIEVGKIERGGRNPQWGVWGLEINERIRERIINGVRIWRVGCSFLIIEKGKFE